MKIAKPTSHNMGSTPRPARHGVNAKSAQRDQRDNGASLARFRKLFSGPELAHLTMRQRQAVAIALGEERFDVEGVKRGLLMLLPAPTGAGPAEFANV
jgi:hypothetical protein